MSAGFDGALGDAAGFSVTASGFAQMTEMLQSLCERLVLVLEGGYTLSVTAKCVAACIAVLLGDKPAVTSAGASVSPKPEACYSIVRTLRALEPHWPRALGQPRAAPRADLPARVRRGGWARIGGWAREQGAEPGSREGEHLRHAERCSLDGREHLAGRDEEAGARGGGAARGAQEDRWDPGAAAGPPEAEPLGMRAGGKRRGAALAARETVRALQELRSLSREEAILMYASQSKPQTTRRG